MRRVFLLKIKKYYAYGMDESTTPQPQKPETENESVNIPVRTAGAQTPAEEQPVQAVDPAQAAPPQPVEAAAPAPVQTSPQPAVVSGGKTKRSKKPLVLLILLLLLAGAGLAAYKLLHKVEMPKPVVSTKKSTQKPSYPGLVLDENKNYGDKYKDGILPVGDKQYVTDKAKAGYIYMCNVNFVPEGQAGAQTRGPWFIGTDKWDVNKKAKVAGAVDWTPQLKIEIVNGKRVVTTNDLPSHKTGTYPVASTDPAYAYDRNPNKISAQSLTYELNASPSYDDPSCVGGEVGVMLTGVALFNGFDAGGRDAGAWEVQDNCDGHPQNKGEYHYHTLSRCITDVSVHTVIGYALDGFPITGPKVKEGSILTTADLDECHGITNQITLDSKKVTQYHYVMTQDFPYSVSCFRSAAIKAPGLPENTGTQASAQSSQPPRR